MSNESEAFCSSGFDGDIVFVRTNNLREAFLHSRDMRVDLRGFSTYCTVAVAKLISVAAHQLHSLSEQNLRVYALELITLNRREMEADVAHVGSSQNRIAQGVNQHVCIAMPFQTKALLPAFRKQYAPEPQVALGGTCMYVVSESYSHPDYFLLLIRSLMPAKSKPRVKRSVWSNGLEAAVAIT